MVMAALAMLVPAAAAIAAVPGELDTTFGGGRVTPPLGPGSGAEGVAIQPDGKVLVTGSSETPVGFSVARLLPNGSPDPGWGGDGLETTPLGEFAGAFDVAVQSDGKVVAVGEAPGTENEDFAVVRYLGSGNLDPSFGGSDGIALVPVGTLDDSARAVAIGPGDRIAVTGISFLPGLNNGAGTAVLEANGTPEAAFGEGGTTIVGVSGDDRGEGIAVQGDGKVVIADSTGGGGGDGFTIARLGLDGKPDPSFGGDGIVKTPIPGEGGAAEGRIGDVVIQPDGRIVGGGYGFDYVGPESISVSKFALARYLSDGELDPSFGIEGIVGAPLPGPGSDIGHTLALAPNGKLVLGGTYDPTASPLEEEYAPAIARFNPNGSLDTGFGAGGSVLVPLKSGVADESLEGLAIQPDSKIIATGTAYPPSAPGIPVVSRYIGEIEAEGVHATRPDERPDTNMKKVPRRVESGDLSRFRGTASDPDGDALRRVQVALVRLVSGKARGAASLKPRHWRTARGKAEWSYKLPKPLPPGRYVVFSRAQDEQGLSEDAFSRRDHNRYTFKVLS